MDKQTDPTTNESAAEQPAKDTKETERSKKQQRTTHKGLLRALQSMPKPQRILVLSFATVVVLAILLAAVPVSRYALLGTVFKRNLAVRVVDSQTGSPISKAIVAIDGQSTATDATGEGRLHVRVGRRVLSVNKQYYRTYSQGQLVNISKNRNQVVIKLVATGRPVSVTVTNKLTGKPLAGATVKALDTEAVTGPNGVATIVLPASTAKQSITVTAAGYNTGNGELSVTGQTANTNSFSVTPVGKLYFLSNLSGKIDVVKTDLDGGNRQTILPGTGYESKNSTVLLASRDWRYLALYAQRKASGNPEIDLIDTSNDTLTNIDEGNASFILTGWDDHYFVYLVDRSGYKPTQNKTQTLKSYNADNRKISVLDEASNSGVTSFDYPYYTYQQSLNSVAIMSNEIVYAESVQTSGAPYMKDQQARVMSIQPDGSRKRVIKAYSYPLTNDYWLNTLSLNIGQTVDDPTTAYFQATASSWNGNYPQSQGFDNSVYQYTNGQVKQRTDLTSIYGDDGQRTTYLLSPSGKQTLWSVYADGKNILKIGDKSGQNGTAITAESDYNPYGWFTDAYVLLQKSGSELYIMASDGTSQPYKIANYYKPQLNYPGYGGGYGGL